jgi:hypothetical protein
VDGLSLLGRQPHGLKVRTQMGKVKAARSDAVAGNLWRVAGFFSHSRVCEPEAKPEMGRRGDQTASSYELSAAGKLATAESARRPLGKLTRITEDVFCAG